MNISPKFAKTCLKVAEPIVKKGVKEAEKPKEGEEVKEKGTLRECTEGALKGLTCSNKKGSYKF